MIKSMTGFGRSEYNGKVGRFTVEIRTVNHRYFDVSSRIPSSLNCFEDKIRNYIHKDLKRGKVNFSLTHRKGAKDFEGVRLDTAAIEKYYKMLNSIKHKFKLKDDIKLAHILSFRDVIVVEEKELDVNKMWPLLEKVINKAVLDCNKMRQKEGRVLYDDLLKRINSITVSINKIYRLIPQIISEYKRKLDSRIRDILKGQDYKIDTRRLETELALFARQCDVSEEITRAKSHLSALRRTIFSSKEAGRRLDFILQELQREINTLGAKIGTVTISQLVVDIKSEIDKMREQVQNVE